MAEALEDAVEAKDKRAALLIAILALFLALSEAGGKNATPIQARTPAQRKAVPRTLVGRILAADNLAEDNPAADILVVADILAADTPVAVEHTQAHHPAAGSC